MVYLDNAATTLPKPKSVIKATEECIKKYCANSGRSSHRAAVKTAEEIFKVRERISDFLGIDAPERVVFTTNATYALNFAIKSIIKSKCHVLVSDLEHNSTIRPINSLARALGVEYSVFSSDGDIYENAKSLIRKDTEAIVSTVLSNVTGKEIPISILCDLAKDYGLKLIIDASQLLGHKTINLSLYHCDALCAPGHKGLFGIQGCGFCVFADSEYEATIIEGGSGNESLNPNMPRLLPEHFEAGTLPSPSIISLGKGLEYINNIGICECEERISKLTKRFYNRILDIRNIEVYGKENGIISFRIKGIPTESASALLAKRGICIRGGLHCAPLAHAKVGTLDTGLIRVSLSIFNNERQADLLWKELREITK